jgi:hypothetical protein
MRDNLSNLHFVPALAPVAAALADNTVQTGIVIDRRGFDSLTFAIVTGVLADADATFAVKLQHGDAADGSDAADCAVADTTGATAAATAIANASFNFGDDTECRKIGYVGAKRYVRVVITPALNAGNAPMAAIAVLGRASIAPTANPPQ